MRLYVFIFVMCFLCLTNCEFNTEKETGSSSKACSDAWKLFQVCRIINPNDLRACDTQWNGIVFSCGMM